MDLNPETPLTKAVSVPVAWSKVLQQHGITNVGEFLGMYAVKESRPHLAAAVLAKVPELDAVAASLVRDLPSQMAKAYLTPTPKGMYTYGAVLPDEADIH